MIYQDKSLIRVAECQVFQEFVVLIVRQDQVRWIMECLIDSQQISDVFVLGYLLPCHEFSPEALD